VKARSLVRGRIFRTPLAAHDRLEYVRDLLDFAYAQDRSPERLQEMFHEWYFGVYSKKAMKRMPEGWRHIKRLGTAVDWPDFQQKLRNKIEAVLDRSSTRDAKQLLDIRWRLTDWNAPDGRVYFYPVVLIRDSRDIRSLVEVAVAMMVNDLTGLSVEAIRQCEECGRLFLRLRPTRARYCSSSCRARAFMARHGYHPRRERKAANA
jgi:hypothetical protein